MKEHDKNLDDEQIENEYKKRGFNNKWIYKSYCNYPLIDSTKNNRLLKSD
jgi:hypothetical protein